MKRLTSYAGLLLAVLSSLFLSSCIYDAPGDKFYRTLWVCDNSIMVSGIDPVSVPDPSSTLYSSQRPSIDDFTIEFLCDGFVSVRADGASGSYGSYEAHGNIAHFTDLYLQYTTSDTTVTIIIEEATRHNDLLEINWHLNGSTTPHINTLSRKSSYN